MKKLCMVLLAAALVVGGSQKVWGSDAKLISGIEGGFLDQCLEKQNYCELKRLLKPIYGDPGVQIWVSAHLAEKHDPFLLFMDSRLIFRTYPRPVNLLARGGEHFMLCIALANVAENVMQKYHGDEPRGIDGELKRKFMIEYGDPRVTGCVWHSVNFEECKEAVLEKLNQLKEDDEALAALPLPFWVIKTEPGKVRWGFWWGALTDGELAVRKNKSVSASIVALTKEALEAYVEVLGAYNSWEDFFGIKSIEVHADSDVISPNPSIFQNMWGLLGGWFGGSVTTGEEKE